MCEIQFVQTMSGTLKREDFLSFSEMLEQGSFTNADAWGIFNSSGLRKQHGAYYEFEKQQHLFSQYGKGHRFLVGHNRLATQGNKKNNENNHPFETENFYLVHNGVITNDSTLRGMKELFYKGDTDSIVILEMIQALTDKGYNIVDAITRTAELLEGSFSVMLYDKRNDTLYYFKNSKTSFSFSLFVKDGRKIVYGSTDSTNFEFVYSRKEMIFDTQEYDYMLQKEATPGVIYEISANDIKEVGKFTEKTTTTWKSSNDNYYTTDEWVRTGDEKAELYESSKTIQEALAKEGFDCQIRLDYQEMCAYFIPTRELSKREETEIFSMFGNNAFWSEDDGAFVMASEDIDTFLYYSGKY